jgi:GTP cyclohydrolase FolE2
VTIQDPFTHRSTRLFGKIEVFFGLPATQRGVHMSRIEECLLSMDSEKDLALSTWMKELSNKLLSTQELTQCTVSLDLHYDKATGRNVSRTLSQELLTLHSAIERNEESVRTCTGLTVSFINACPCTQRWAMREFFQRLLEQGYDTIQAENLMYDAPLQAHTNLGKASLKIWSDQATHQRLYDVVAQAVPIVRELLKGVDEHALVSQAHRDGQFCEDNARALVREVLIEFDGTLEDDTLLEINVDVAESVHFHNLSTEINSSFGDLRANFKSPSE